MVNPKRFIERIAIKAALVCLLAFCFMDMQREYYNFVRVAACVLFICQGFLEADAKNRVLAVPSFLLAVLFNPVEKFEFHRATWQAIDGWLIGAVIAWGAWETWQYSRGYNLANLIEDYRTERLLD